MLYYVEVTSKQSREMSMQQLDKKIIFGNLLGHTAYTMWQMMETRNGL